MSLELRVTHLEELVLALRSRVAHLESLLSPRARSASFEVVAQRRASNVLRPVVKSGCFFDALSTGSTVVRAAGTV
ncbi:hypothetical protein AK812_SmicGene3304 [Symbiodinium microadriaticum]|uniref:Uncharacterized protein n=1 Tax=Symbiodinium microadriaticum TaxID=2951 RepID=A0A1Q9EZA3_SYMMI|nr:hypothetical protein AK812_SmicGene3304 [Symbiodinium microadriaticum]